MSGVGVAEGRRVEAEGLTVRAASASIWRRDRKADRIRIIDVVAATKDRWPAVEIDQLPQRWHAAVVQIGRPQKRTRNRIVDIAQRIPDFVRRECQRVAESILARGEVECGKLLLPEIFAGEVAFLFRLGGRSCQCVFLGLQIGAPARQ